MSDRHSKQLEQKIKDAEKAEQSALNIKILMQQVLSMVKFLRNYSCEERLLFLRTIAEPFCDKCGTDKDKTSCSCYAY